MIKFLTLFLVSGLTIISATAQELNCTVDIEYSKVQSTDPKVFETLRSSIAEFMNSRKWTNDVYQDNEKIDCSILINIDVEYSANEFGGQFIINSVRPVYNSAYKTIVFSSKDDDFRFTYNQFDNLEFSDNNYFSNLTSFLAYYAYMVIGSDYDSFSPKGGTEFFLKAQDVITAIPVGQRARYPGWDAFGSKRNRAIHMTELTNSRYNLFREAMFKWHYDGLDKMYDDPEKGREVISESLNMVEKIYKDNPNTMLVKIFFLAKSEEIISLYSNASSSEKDKLINKISGMDPVNATKYSKIR